MAGKKKTDTDTERTFKGVYKHGGAYRARVWDRDLEVYCGHFGAAAAAGRAYDRAAIRLRGADSAALDGLNYPLADYQAELPALLNKPLTQVVQELRASGISAPAA